MKRRIMLLVVVIAIVAVGAAMTVAVPTLPDRGSAVPTARVAKTPLKLTVHATGDLRAGRTVTLVTPPVGGGTLRIVRLVQTGMPVKANDIVMELDPADQQFALEQAGSELAEAEQEIVKMKADGAVQKAEDEVALLTARFDLRRAELDATGNEFIAPVDAKKNVLSLEEARRRLAQLQEDVKSRATTSQASLAVVEEKRHKAMLSMQRAQQVIESLVLRAPLDGVVSLKENRNAAGGMFFWGMVLPEYREGDQVFPGQPVADVIESGRMEVRAKIDENDRGNLTPGQQAAVHVDALPGHVFTARVGSLAGLASRANFFDTASVSRLFDVTFQFDEPDPRLKAGASARLVIEGTQLSDALHVPRQAVFARAGKNHVFLKVGERFEEREVKVTQRTESRVVIEGLTEGAEIALVDPNTRPAGATQPSAPAVPRAGPPR
ncbi:MAG: efflux RND transporter periplasmic adaptor subunit [Vicinamibacterales bacterium]